jgi:hypothetical protein
VIPIGQDSYFTQGTRVETLCRSPYDSGRASALEQTRAEKPCWTSKDSNRASTPKLRGGLPTGWEALRPLEPLHSPYKATPNYYTKNESFGCGISKVWCVCRLSPRGGVFIGVNGTSTNLEKSVWCQVVAAGRPSHVAGRPSRAASTDFLHRLRLLLLM